MDGDVPVPQATTDARDSELAPDVLDKLALEVQELRQELVASEAELASVLDDVHPDNRASARNLVHYLALRRYDLRALQLGLARVGLSSLGRSEPHVLVTLDRILGMLALARDAEANASSPAPVGFREGEAILAANADRLLGPAHPHRNVRIVVTLPAEAATDPTIADDLVAAGMDCARINCARDDATAWTAMADHVRGAARAHGRECRILVDLSGPKLRTGAIAGGASRLLLSKDDCFELVMETGQGLDRRGSLPRIACTAPEIFRDAKAGQPIWFDDGSIGGVIEENTGATLLIRITHAKPQGSKLRSERGINLPETLLGVAGLTEKDLSDLPAVIGWADAIELSFAQRPEDVVALRAALERLNAGHVGIVLKIETRQGFAELPELLLAAMRQRSCGVMIARGDLAVESGFERMAEVQEEILWIAEAAHVPTIWATQVLDNLAKDGTLTRAEMTDAAMSARAEAVMLNKGPFILDAIRTLDDILARMHEHQSKKRALLRALRVGSALWD
jgi:pyruvate kinase